MKPKYRFTNNAPQLTDQEIEASKDFKSLMGRRTHALKKRQKYQKITIKAGISVLLISLIGSGVFVLNNFNSKPEKKNSPIAKVDSTTDEIIHEETQPIAKDETTNKVETENEKTAIQKEKSELVKKDSPKPEATQQKLEDKPITESEQPTSKPDKKGNIGEERSLTESKFENAYPLIGIDSLTAYLNANLKYPESVDKSLEIKGTVIVLFTIDTLGRASGLQIQKSLGKEFDEASIKLIKNMPPWQPATRNGQPVSSQVSIPLTFNLDKKQSH
ncbi:TonB family protein [Marivirga sp. S37H4]|uniref:TonB family protein n=1 Tax=Marivirga aurantiaca TaxID=2802615 RepID=A0A934WYQ5_9BACT|nr:energy transducer TonB [Marivirga aurantiaca]MBK6265459.1 TonB family protein [Marivirga aurantiaca]